LQEEARNTERHQSFWNTDQRLRHNKVKFVSAGTLDPRELESKDAKDALAEMTLDSAPEDAGEATSEEPIRDPTPVVPSPIVEEQLSAYFVVDTLGKPVNTGLPSPQVRSTSPTPSNSSEEVILFGGRDQNGKGISREQKTKPQSASIDAKIKIVEDQIHVREELLDEVLLEKSASPPRSTKAQNQPLISDQNQGLAIRGRKGNRHQNDEDAIIADYITNMDEDDNLLNNKPFRPRELGGAEDEVWLDELEESSGEPIQDSVEPVQGGWERSDIRDFDELSTSGEVMGAVQEILSKRERESGVQYLVVWENQTTDEARWVPVTTLTAIGALSLIELFEAEEKLVAEFMDQGDEDTSDSDDVDINDGGHDEDDDDLVERKIDRMSDEQIARMLAKQEELGMGSDELLLFGDEADAEDDVEDDVDMGLADSVLNPFLLGPTMDQYSGPGARRPRGEFPSASALADSYDGFDVMDFDRPSLKKKPKGRKGKLAFDLSDSEFEASMQMAFENDRLKKKERKQEREKLRAQGLLGNKNGKPDLKQKFKEGMSIHDVKDQIKGFLIGDSTT
jgi:hypothetical protein